MHSATFSLDILWLPLAAESTRTLPVAGSSLSNPGRKIVCATELSLQIAERGLHPDRIEICLLFGIAQERA